MGLTLHKKIAEMYLYRKVVAPAQNVSKAITGMRERRR